MDIFRLISIGVVYGVINATCWTEPIWSRSTWWVLLGVSIGCIIGEIINGIK